VAALLAGRAPVVQRALGFEAEIDLGVEDKDHNKYKGDTDLAASTQQLPELSGQEKALPAFSVVSDSRGSGDEAYSNIEFVSGAASVVGDGRQTGIDLLDKVAEDLRQ
jgi:hypothetical protein